MQTTAIGLAACLLLGTAWAQKAPTYEESNQKSQASTKSANRSDVATKSFKGTLVDASCASGPHAQNQSAGKANNTADRADAGAPAVSKSGTTDENKACAVSSSTKEFALRMNDGHIMRFDPVGNERTQEAIKNQKKWNTAASNGKSISAKVTGVAEGDHLTVTSIN